MNNLINKLVVPALLATSAVMSPALFAEDTFDGHTVNVAFEVWQSGDVAAVLGVTNEQNIAASDAMTPDAENFFVFKETVDHFDWSVDFHQDMIELTYTSIYAQDHDNQYMYTSSKGFHFHDVEGTLPDITGVTLMDDQFAPFGFDPGLISFDADNIYVNLDGSMCHIAGMASMPNCANTDSPTGFENRIMLQVEFAGSGMGMGHDHAQLDALFDALEEKYPEFFPEHQQSSMITEYYARYYEGTDVYVGVKDNTLYAYGDQFGGLLDAGAVDTWLETMQIQDTGCPEGQHMMSDGMCMNNGAM